VKRRGKLLRRRTEKRKEKEQKGRELVNVISAKRIFAF
jgi:hypothetical protein